MRRTSEGGVAFNVPPVVKSLSRFFFKNMPVGVLFVGVLFC